MIRLRVTVCEMNDNRKLFAKDWEHLVDHVGRESSDLVLLPEMPFYKWFCTTSKFDPQVWKLAVREHQRWIRRLDELGVSVVLGSMPIDAEKRKINQGFMWTEGGGAKGVHAKSYLPDEAGWFEASWYDRGGGVFASFDVNELRVGFMICSDMWAMQHASAYGRAGAHLIAVPRATPKSSIEKWVAGGKVVAVVSGAFCIASNRVGRGIGVDFGGSAWVIDPDGKILGLTSRQKPFITVEVDAKEAEKAKNTYPRNVLQPD